MGFKKNIEIERMKTYADWFYQTHLIPHFKTEETHIFPLLDVDNKLVKRALAEHRRLKYLFTTDKNITKALSLIEKELEQHIRFEERILFPEIQKTATQVQLQRIEKVHPPDEKFNDNLNDVFWK